MREIASLWPDDQQLGFTGSGESFRMSTGQEYCIAGTLAAVHPDLTQRHRVALSRYVVDHFAGQTVVLTTYNYEEAISRPPIPSREKARRLMRSIVQTAGGVPTTLHWELSPHIPGYISLLRDCGFDIDRREIAAHLAYLHRQGWIEFRDSSTSVRIILTLEGLIAFEEDQSKIDGSLCFVAMWFHEAMDALYEQGIAPAVEALGYTPFRVDRHQHNNRIDDEILAGIRRCRFMIADFTQGEDGPRGGVYYEAGFASGLGRPVIHTVRSDQIELVHFDTSHVNHILWSEPLALMEPLRNRIEATIGRHLQ